MYKFVYIILVDGNEFLYLFVLLINSELKFYIYLIDVYIIYILIRVKVNIFKRQTHIRWYIQ